MKVILLNLMFLVSACDFNHFKECEWTLEPEVKNLHKINAEAKAQSFVPVCARNRVTNKQNCNLKANLTYAKEVYGKMFVYNDMVVEKTGSFPRSVVEIKKFCK